MDDDQSSVAVILEAGGWRDALPDAAPLARRVIAATLERAAPAPWLLDAQVCVLLADDGAVRQLNAAWRGQDRPTNVLSFPTLEIAPGEVPPRPAGTPELGDLALALETVRLEAAAEAKTLADHVAHLLVHGTLHLLGHDHRDDAEADAMEDLERRVLADLGIADPYRERDPVDTLETTR